MCETSEFAKLDQQASILQATFEHYHNVALDHHTKAATTSNLLLVIVGAVLALIGFDQEVCGIVDAGVSLFVILIGLFGATWVWKQIERYKYWRSIAEKYQEALNEIAPKVKKRIDYDKEAEGAAIEESTFPRLKAGEEPSWLVKRIRSFTSWTAQIPDRSLWVGLHFFVSVLGFFMFVISISCAV